MQTAEVRLPSIEAVQRFVTLVNTLEEDVDLGSGARLIDAKSILGVMAMVRADVTRLMLTVHSEDKNSLKKLQCFLC